MAIDPVSMGLLGLGAAKTLFGGGTIEVPGAIAKPTRPDLLDENGLMNKQYRLSGQTDANQQAAQGLISDLTAQAQSTSPSPYAQSLINANNQQTKGLLDQAKRANSSNLATSQANLAMKGGLSSGGVERLAQSSGNNLMNQKMNINAQNSLTNMNTLAQDEDRKLGLLQNMIGANMDQAKFNTGLKQYDIGNAMNTSMNFYNQDMKNYGANQMAISQANAHNAANKGLLSGLF